MAPLPRKRSLADMQRAERMPPAERSDDEYYREVLQLEDGQTEEHFDSSLVTTAEGLGITVSRPASPARKQHPAHSSMCGSAVTVTSQHARTASTRSRGSNSTGMTSRSSNEQLDSSAPHKRGNPRRSLSFSEYERLAIQAEAQAAARPGFNNPPPIPAEPAPSLFSVSTRRSYASIKSSFKSRFRMPRSKTSSKDLSNSCICCRDDFKKPNNLHRLLCNDSYCDSYVRTLIAQAIQDESKMPPRCCMKPISSVIIKSVLSNDEQQTFMKSVSQFSTPWDARIFCSNTACGEFIPKRGKIDPKHPFDVTCRQCRTRACSTCKGAAHDLGQDCPADWELDDVLQIREKLGCRRCYKCRNLVDVTHGCNYVVCQCNAQFCYICCAVWDPVVGCPNYCCGEEELERRRLEEQARIVELELGKAAREEAEKVEAAEKINAERRTAESEVLDDLRARQINERDRFCGFERKMKWIMWTRHGQSKLDVLDRYAELQTKMRERHAKTANHLEDRQVAAEMELRATLKQAEKSVAIRLRHMEAYCDGLGHSNGNNPVRVVTERDLRELGQQYNIRDDLERLHQSKVNVMRDKQAKQMEQLLVKQEEETEKLISKQEEELTALDETFANEEDDFMGLYKSRRDRLKRRWSIMEKVERKTLENGLMVRFAPIRPVLFPAEEEQKTEEQLESVTE